MTALDSCEPQVIRAFQKEGWEIFQKPYYLLLEGRSSLIADMSLQRVQDGITENIIVVEVKCFTNPKNDITEFYTALGQYHLYRSSLKVSGINYPVFLALPETAYERLTQYQAIVDAMQTLALKLVAVNLDAEEIVRWVT